jgi:hypothetical protein
MMVIVGLAMMVLLSLSYRTFVRVRLSALISERV